CGPERERRRVERLKLTATKLIGTLSSRKVNPRWCRGPSRKRVMPSGTEFDSPAFLSRRVTRAGARRRLLTERCPLRHEARYLRSPPHHFPRYPDRIRSWTNQSSISSRLGASSGRRELLYARSSASNARPTSPSQCALAAASRVTRSPARFVATSSCPCW